MSSSKSILKISTQNIYHMLIYVYEDLYNEEIEKQEDFFKQLDGLMAELLISGISRQLKRGLYKEYVRFEEPLSIIRGKIDMHSSIKLKTQVSRQLNCEYDEFNKDNLYNQILKSTCLFLMRQGRISQQKRKKLKDVLYFLNEVSEVSLRAVIWENIRFHKDKFAYRSLIGLCYIIYKGLVQDEETEKSYLNELAFSDLYERFIQNFFVRECTTLRLGYQGKYTKGEDRASHLKNILTVDMLLTYKTHRLIVNTHCFVEVLEESKNSESKTFLINQISRLIGTVKRNKFNARGYVSGMMLYPSVEMQYMECYKIEEHEVYMGALNLTLPFEEIKRQLMSIGEFVRTSHQG